jgi:hypothetical protein
MRLMDARVRRWSPGALMLALVASALSLSACGRLQAKTPAPAPAPAPPPPLAMPEPPQRLHVPVTAEPPPVPAAATDKPGSSSSTPNRPRPAPAPPPAQTPPDATPPPVLQAGAPDELATRAKDRLSSADRDLAKVQVASLGADAREQYESARKFARMAKDALTAKNYVYAAYCADKAATLAALLLKRG